MRFWRGNLGLMRPQLKPDESGYYEQSESGAYERMMRTRYKARKEAGYSEGVPFHA